MGQTPTYGLRYQELGDAPDGAALGANLAADVEAELQRVDTDTTNLRTDVDDLESRLGAGAFVGTGTGDFSGTVEIREGANGIVTAFGNLDVDVDTGGGWVATGIVVPVELQPASVAAGGFSEIIQASNYYNGTNQYRYRIVSGGSLEFQHTGADGTFETLSANWFKAIT